MTADKNDHNCNASAITFTDVQTVASIGRIILKDQQTARRAKGPRRGHAQFGWTGERSGVVIASAA